MIIDENTELSGEILLFYSRDVVRNYYTFRLKDVEKVIRYKAYFYEIDNIINYGGFCDIGTKQDLEYQHALIKLKKGLYLICYTSFDIWNIKEGMEQVDFMPYFKEKGLYEEREIDNLRNEWSNFLNESNNVYKANPALYQYYAPSYECYCESDSYYDKTKNINDTTLEITLSETEIDQFDYVIINGVKFKKE